MALGAETDFNVNCNDVTEMAIPLVLWNITSTGCMSPGFNDEAGEPLTAIWTEPSKDAVSLGEVVGKTDGVVLGVAPGVVVSGLLLRRPGLADADGAGDTDGSPGFPEEEPSGFPSVVPSELPSEVPPEPDEEDGDGEEDDDGESFPAIQFWIPELREVPARTSPPPVKPSSRMAAPTRIGHDHPPADF